MSEAPPQGYHFVDEVELPPLGYHFADEPPMPKATPITETEGLEGARQALRLQGETQPNSPGGQLYNQGANVIGAAETLGTLGSASASEILGGIAAIIQALNPGSQPGAGAQAVKQAREQGTYQPRTDRGRQMLQTVGETLQPVAEAMKGGGEVLGHVGAKLGEPFGETGQAVGYTMGKTALPAAGAALGLPGVQRGVWQAGKALVKPVSEITEGIFQYQRPATRSIAKLLLKDPKDPDTVGYMIKPGTDPRPQGGQRIGGPTERPHSRLREALLLDEAKIIKNPIEKAALKQGIEARDIAAMKTASPATRRLARRMVEVRYKGSRDAVYELDNRPHMVVGDSILKRANVVFKVNRQAAESLEEVSKSLRGHRNFDFNTPVNRLLGDLENIGIDTEAMVAHLVKGGKLKDPGSPDFFEFSDIQGASGAENLITKIVERMRGRVKGGNPDAYDAHRLKQFIDEQVSYGKMAEGLTGKSEMIIKRFRHNLNKALGDSFPDYRRVNTAYSETRDIIEGLQDVAGKRVNLLDEYASGNLGMLSRRVSSNAMSGGPVTKAIRDVEAMARKYGGKFDDDTLTLITIQNSLEKVFGSSGPTSFKGQIEGADVLAEGAKVMSGTKTATAAVVEGGLKTVNQLRGINPQAQFKAYRDLLK